MSLVLTTYGRQQMINAFWTPDIFTALTDVWVTYTTTVPLSNSDGSQLDEPSAVAGFARVSYPLHSDKWSPTGFGEIYNTEERFFSSPTSDWGLIQGMALVDASALGTGNVLAVGSVVEPFQAAVGIVPLLAIGDVTIGLYE